MYHKIVMTGGISLFNKDNLFGKLTRNKNFFSFDRTNPFPKDEQNEEEEFKNWLKEMRNHLSKTKGQEENISAEYSMLYSLKKNNKLGESSEIVLIHTNTFGGKIAACLNKEILEREFNAKVKLEEIKELDVTERVKLNRSLGDFMSLINRHLSEGHKSYMCFAPIGGYKIFSSLGYIVASFNDMPTAYLHEDRQVFHEIPPVPVKYDETFIEENIKFLRKLYIKSIIEERDLEYHQIELIKENSHFFETLDHLVSINPFGLFICNQDKFKHIFGIQIFLSERVRQLIEQTPSAEEFVYQQIGVLVKKIESKEDNASLYHEREFRILKDKKLKYHLYKGASNGTHVFRVAWKYNEERRNLYINFVWLDHDIYEREVVKGTGLEEEFGDFKEVSQKVYQAQK